MVKSDIKNGMSFKTRYGDKCYIIDSKVYKNSDKDESILGLWGSLEECLKSYDNELLVLHESPHGADIMEVYDCDNNLIWERQEIDWSKVPIDTKVYVRNNDNDYWHKEYFASYSKDTWYTYLNGKTSWSNNSGSLACWNQCKLAETDEPKKEVTLQEIEKTFTKFCVNQRKDDYTRGCSKCIYNDASRKINGTSCEIKWLLDSYNVTEK